MNNHVRTATWVLILLLAVGLVSIAVTAAVVGADNTRVIRQAQQDNNETLRIIRSCTTPGAECHDRGQKATAAAIADINQVSIYAAACADQPGDQSADEIYACVIRKLAADNKS